jgi:hypothetical protein
MAPRNREAWLAHITEVVLASIRTKARRRR